MKITQKDIAKKVKDIAKAKACHPAMITKRDLQKEYPEITDWTLKTLGGIDAIKKAFFPVDDKALAEIHETKEVNTYIAKLERQLGEKQFLQKKLIEVVENNIKPLPQIKPDRRIYTPTSEPLHREIVTVLNDTHYGLLVSPDEIGGLNSFGWTEACRRTALVLQETITYKMHHRNEIKKVHLVLNGDLIQGVIHGLAYRQMEKNIHQINGAIHILTYMIQGLAQTFPEVEVHGVCGNHEDSLHKREGGKRVSQEKYDSQANIIFYALSAAFRNNRRIKFNFPKTPYVYMDLPGGRCMVNHGDTLFSKALGWPGTSINVKALSDEIRKFNSAEVSRGREPIKLMLFGHVHSYAHFITPEGVVVYVAPSLSGTDSYAHSLTINNNVAGQVVFESTKKFIMGDSRLIKVTEADNNSALDKLIPVYGNELAWKK